MAAKAEPTPPLPTTSTFIVGASRGSVRPACLSQANRLRCGDPTSRSVVGRGSGARGRSAPAWTTGTRSGSTGSRSASATRRGASDDFAIRRASSSPCSGPSGCGKTTTLRMIAGSRRRPRGGSSSRASTCRTPPYRRNVNTVFQQYALFPHLDVERNVAFGLEEPQGGRRPRSPAGRRDARDRPHGGLRQAAAGPALGRPAAAGGARPGAGEPARRPSCSTSRSPRSTSSCARPCSSSSSASSARSASPSSSSPTTSRRRSP